MKTLNFNSISQAFNFLQTRRMEAVVVDNKPVTNEFGITEIKGVFNIIDKRDNEAVGRMYTSAIIDGKHKNIKEIKMVF